MVTALRFQTKEGEKLVSLGQLVLYLFERLPKKEQEKFLAEVEPFVMGGLPVPTGSVMTSDPGWE